MLGETQQFSASDVARCRALVAEIDARARATGAYDTQRYWTGDSNDPVYQSVIDPASVTSGFLVDLPQRVPFFTGWPAEGVTLNESGWLVWRLLRALPPPLGARVFVRWWHRLQLEPRYNGLPLTIARALARHLARQLPLALRPQEDFDGTDQDRLALCERLVAMQKLSVLGHLSQVDSPVILEIGAGYGMLAAAVRRAFPRCTYLVVDLPNSLAFSGCYLASRQDGSVRVVADERPSPGDVGLVLTTDLAAVEGIPIDVAINTLSFAEMPESVVEGYGAFLRRNLAPGGHLFEQNYDNSHCGRSTFCDPQIALARHLREVSRASGWYLRGVPRLWVRS
ncbi:MAG TPA: putative sugar O-methyltransferase [Stellaceae bacterium]|nr:putative sugar O-methyltransferase [Stellaceae bacterium]